jgi:hypothetical protein
MATLTIFIYQKPSMPTVVSILRVMAGHSKRGWSLMPENRDALIDRARSIAATRWLTKSNDDVLVMSDDDFAFTLEGIDALADLAIEHQCIAAGVTPLKGGDYTTIVPLDGSDAEPWRDSRMPPMRVRWAGGLIAYPRCVFERLRGNLPCLHENDVIEEFYPYFMPMIHRHEGKLIYLSEDYACQERARERGIETWVQPACQVGHLASNLLVTTKNMDQIKGLYS